MKAVPVRCNGKKIRHRGPCNVIRGRRRYRRIIRFFSQRFACRCIRRKQIRLRLCFCGRPRLRKVCRRGFNNIYRDYYYIRRVRARGRIEVRCVRRSRRVSRRLVRKCPLPLRLLALLASPLPLARRMPPPRLERTRSL